VSSGASLGKRKHHLGALVERQQLIETVPIVFGDDPPLLGVFSLPQNPGSAARGVVVCAPLFHQNVCSYRPLRNLAVRIAEQGWPTLRFDWPNCGDSGDTPIVSVSAWTSAVTRAVEAMRTHTEVDDVCLVGLRMGATFAMLAALGETEVSAISLLGPFATGRAYLRELRSFEVMAAHVFTEPAQPPPPLPEGAMEAGGFLLSAAEVGALEGVDLVSADYSSLAAARVQIAVAQPDRGITGLVEAAQASGVEVDYTVAADLARAWDGTLHSYLAQNCGELVCAWLSDKQPAWHAS
jgi:pimeloyl-ACP methyl ester carboxylesterase